MSKKRKSKARCSRREFLKALPTVGVAFKWTADKLGGALVTALATLVLKVFTRSGVTVINTRITPGTGHLQLASDPVLIPVSDDTPADDSGPLLAFSIPTQIA